MGDIFVDDLFVLIVVELYGFGWLDDLVVVGLFKVCLVVQYYVLYWLWWYCILYGDVLEWVFVIVGWCVLYWIFYVGMILLGLDCDVIEFYFWVFDQYLIYLCVIWFDMFDGLFCFEVLVGFVIGVMLLCDCQVVVQFVLIVLVEEVDVMGVVILLEFCVFEILLEVMVLLVWVQEIVDEVGQFLLFELWVIIVEIVLILCVLCYVDGGLFCFYGGGWGVVGWLDCCLCVVEGVVLFVYGLVMGFVCMVW